jgi:hypothetical protein
MQTKELLKTYNILVFALFSPQQNQLVVIDNIRKQIASATSSFWHNNSGTWPDAARAAYASIAFSNIPIQTLKGKQLDDKLNNIILNVNGLVSALMETNNPSSQAFVKNTIYPLFNSLRVQIEKLKNTPEQPFQNIDKNIQIKLNKILVPTGDILPIKEDGVLGQETMNALSKYKKRFNVNSNSLAELINFVGKNKIAANELLSSAREYLIKTSSFSPSKESIIETIRSTVKAANLFYIPETIRALIKEYGMSIEYWKKEIMLLEKEGLITLQPESGQGRLKKEDREYSLELNVGGEIYVLTWGILKHFK